MTNDPLKKRKIAVLGPRSVGKSSLAIQFTENHFVEPHHRTIETTSSKSINHNGVEFDCDIIDNAEYSDSILSAKHVIGIRGYVLVYSVTSIVFDKIIGFCSINEIPCVIVGTKIDLKKSSFSRQVAENEGVELAKAKNAAWVETSAQNNISVGKVFELCVAEIEKRSSTGQSEPQPSKCVVM